MRDIKLDSLREKDNLLRVYLCKLFHMSEEEAQNGDNEILNHCEDSLLKKGFFTKKDVFQNIQELNCFCLEVKKQVQAEKKYDFLDCWYRLGALRDAQNGQEDGENLLEQLPEDRAMNREEDSSQEISCNWQKQTRVFYQQIREALLALSTKDQSRFLAAFFARRSLVREYALRSPSQCPARVAACLHARSNQKESSYGSRLSQEEKYKIIWNFEGQGILWDIVYETFLEETAYKDRFFEKSQYSLYKKRGEFTRNITRDKENMYQSLVRNIHPLTPEIEQLLKKSLENISLPEKLGNINPVYYSERDLCLIPPATYKGCGAFSERLVQYAFSCAEGKGKEFAACAEADAFYEHLYQCPKCYQDAQRLARSFQYRRMRLSYHTPFAASAYPPHQPQAANIQQTQDKNLVQIYKRLYELNPCDLNAYYLLLSYVQAGKIQEAKKFWKRNKSYAASLPMQNSFLATVLEGVDK